MGGREVVAAAQKVPGHVVEAIAQLLLNKVPEPPTNTYPPLLPRRPVHFLPLMGVCRRWRAAVVPLYYDTVLLGMGGMSADETREARLHFTVDHAVAAGCGHHVRTVYMPIDLYSFNRTWGADAPNLASVFRRCSELPAVRSALLRFRPVTDSGGKLGRFAGRRVAQNIDAFAAALYEALPTLQRMDIYTSGHYGGTATENRIVEQVNGSVRRLVREHIMLATLSHLDECEGIASMPEATQLRSLALWQRDLPPHHQELVRRNASTLERLHINQINCASVAGLLADDNGRATVYPRLKHLYIRWCNSRDGPMAEAAGAVDQLPFPCLETLSCRGEFPLTLQIVQGQGRAQLRHLDIEVDGAVLAALMAGAGAFTSLAYVALRARGGETFSIVRDGLFAALCALGPQVQTACCWHLDSGHIERALSTVLVPASLQRLDLAYTLHTVDQAIAVLCACPALLKAGFGLCDLPDARGRGMPDEDLLVSYQHKYRTHAASVAYVGFSRLTFASARRAAEMIVLLVDILPSIVRATVVASGVGCSTDVLKGIAAACKRPPYTNRPHLGHVRFAFENCW